MIAGSGFRITLISDIFRNTVLTTSSVLEEMTEGMYEVATAMDRLVETLKELKWIDIWTKWWDYVKRLTASKLPRQKRCKATTIIHPQAPSDYG